MRAARLLVLKPADVDEAVGVLADRDLLRVCDDGCIELTRAGRERAARLTERLNAFFALCVDDLSEEERAVLADLLRRAFSMPGSYYARRPLAGEASEAFDARRGLAATAMLHYAVQTAVKKATSLSLTDFRFLLELYPKRRTAARMMRARDMVAFLRTGRAYVTTASVRLEEQGYLVRVPDERDARGILFKLTPRCARLGELSLLRAGGRAGRCGEDAAVGCPHHGMPLGPHRFVRPRARRCEAGIHHAGLGPATHGLRRAIGAGDLSACPAHGQFRSSRYKQWGARAAL